MKKAIIGIIVVIVAALLIWYASSSSGAPGQAPAATTTSQAAASQKSSAAGTPSASVSATPSNQPTLPTAKSATVVISDFAFVGKDITVARGSTVTWVNRDSMAHTVTSFPGGPMSGELEKGMTYSFTFTKAGTYNYHCSIHPGMTGTVVVQ